MILHDGTDTRVEAHRPGPYCDEMAVVLDRLDDYDDMGAYEGGGPWAQRFGRRLLVGDSQGFMHTETYTSSEGASTQLAVLFPYDDED